MLFAVVADNRTQYADNNDTIRQLGIAEGLPDNRTAIRRDDFIQLTKTIGDAIHTQNLPLPNVLQNRTDGDHPGAKRGINAQLTDQRPKTRSVDQCHSALRAHALRQQ